jgi:ubiquitin-protein ligase E3 C
MLISGTETAIDVDDLKQHVVYNTPYHENHPVIVMFWHVVDSFSAADVAALVKVPQSFFFSSTKTQFFECSL